MWIHVPKLLLSAFAAEGEAWTWPSQASSLAATDALLFVSGKPTQQRSLQRAWKKHSYLRLLSGMTLPRFLVNYSVERYISSTPGILASPSVVPEIGLESKTPGTCGPTLPGSSERSSQSGASSRTSEGTSALDSSRCGETFADLVTRLKQDYSVRRKSALRIRGNDSTSWPTPAAGFNQESEDPEKWAARREECRIRKKNGNGFGMQLGMTVRVAGTPLWPTPRRASANENRTMKPTPSQEMGKHGKYLAGEVQRRWATPTAQCVDMDTLERNSFSRHALAAMKGRGTPYETQNDRYVESCVCGVSDGLSVQLERHLWPAGPGAFQYEHEPARITSDCPDRADRLKLLGNAVCPQTAALAWRTLYPRLAH